MIHTLESHLFGEIVDRGKCILGERGVNEIIWIFVVAFCRKVMGCMTLSTILLSQKDSSSFQWCWVSVFILLGK